MLFEAVIILFDFILQCHNVYSVYNYYLTKWNCYFTNCKQLCHGTDAESCPKSVRLCDVAGGFKSFSAISPNLLRSDLWNSCDIGDSNFGDKLSHCRELRSDTFRCHPSADEVSNTEQ